MPYIGMTDPPVDRIARWKRHRDGDGSTAWTATINGTHVIVANMQAQSVRFTGTGAHVFVWTSDHADAPWDLARRQVHTDYTVRDAKAWAASHLEER